MSALTAARASAACGGRLPVGVRSERKANTSIINPPGRPTYLGKKSVRTSEATIGRVLDFDQTAAEAAAQLAAARQRNGKTINIRDTQIAGIVIARKAELATRNVQHFSDVRIQVINPWGTHD